MRYFIILLVLALFAISCHNDEPKDLLSKDKMGTVLWDYLQNDLYTHEFLKDSLHNDTVVNMNLQKKLFDKHHITVQAFNDSYDYYLSKPDIFKVILDSMVTQHRRMDTVAAKKVILPKVEL